MRRAVKKGIKVLISLVVVVLILTAPSFFVVRYGDRSFSLLGPLVALQDFFTEINSPDFFVVEFGKTPRNILEYIPNYLYASSSYLMAGSLASLFIGIAIGIRFGLKQRRWTQSIIAFFSAIPDFILVIMLQILSVFLYQHFNFRLGRFNYSYVKGIMLLPFVTLLIVSLSYTIQVATRFTVQIISEEYIRYAAAKGLSKARIIIGHILPGVINSMRGNLLKIISLNLGSLFIIERMFNMPGLTRLLFTFGFSIEYSRYWGLSTYTANLRIAITVILLLSFAVFVTYLVGLILLQLIRKGAEHAV